MTQYRAVLHNPTNGRPSIESIWVNDLTEAQRVGKNGLEFYGGTTFTIEDTNGKKYDSEGNKLS